LELEDLLVGVAMGPLLEERPERRGAQVAAADQPLVSLMDPVDVKRWAVCGFASAQVSGVGS